VTGFSVAAPVSQTQLGNTVRETNLLNAINSLAIDFTSRIYLLRHEKFCRAATSVRCAMRNKPFLMRNRGV
jgi:hypothetical protein